MTSKLVLILLISVHWNVFGQTNDTCQCRLIYGDVMYPTLVTYHHDSLVSYKRAIHLNNYKVLDKFNIDSVFRIENYKWHTWTQTYLLRNEGIGQKVNDDFYIFHPFNLLNIGEKFNSYGLEYSNTLKDSVLYKDSYEIVSHFKLNGNKCNCYESERYALNSDINLIDLSRQSLESIYTTESMVAEDTTAFVWADACEFGIIKTCYLTGIGSVSIDLDDKHAHGENYIVPIVILDSKCFKYFKSKLNLNTISDP